MNKSELLCTVCKKQKKEPPSARKSRLISDLTLFLCSDCLSAKREPRWAIIVVGRIHGLAAVDEYIRLHRYVGADITAKELV